PVTRSAIFIVAAIEPGDDNAETVRALCADIAALVRSVGKRIPAGNLSCVCGFASDAWDRRRPLYKDALAAWSRPIRRAVTVLTRLPAKSRATRPSSAPALPMA